MLKKGDVVTCGHCDEELGIVSKEITYGSKPKPADFMWFRHKFSDEDDCVCKTCGGPWFNLGRIHTRRGWIDGN